jgi:hypothetical protein
MMRRRMTKFIVKVLSASFGVRIRWMIGMKDRDAVGSVGGSFKDAEWS